MEVGYWFFAKSELQNTADMAALAGAQHYVITSDKGITKIAVIADARDNHFDPFAGRLTVNIPPISGSYQGLSAVQVEIDQELPTFLVHMFKSDPIMATVTAVAAIRSESLPACVVTLGTSGTTISVGGNVDISLSGCVMHSNSSGSSAINAFGSSELDAACTSSVGGQSLTSTHSFTSCDNPKKTKRSLPIHLHI